MKDLQKLNGAKVLSTSEQENVKGGRRPLPCPPELGCSPFDNCCVNGMCGRIGWDGNCYPV